MSVRPHTRDRNGLWINGKRTLIPNGKFFAIRSNGGTTELRISDDELARLTKDGPAGVAWGYRGEVVQVGVREEDSQPLFTPVVREMDLDEYSGAIGGKKSYQPNPGSLPAAILDAMQQVRLREDPQLVPEEVVRD